MARWRHGLGHQGRAVALAMVVALVTLASLALRLDSPAWLIADSPHDDALWAKLAGHLLDGDWLGPYDKLTLAKGPAYPLFVAGAYELHLPLKLAEHLLHMAAGALMGVALWRVCGSRVVGLAAYGLIALDPAYLGAPAAKVTRESFYGSLCLLLVAGVLLLLTSVPALVRRGPAWSVPTVAVAGAGLGVVGAAYHLCRDERLWLVPALVIAAAAGLARWRAEGPVRVAHGLVVAGALVAAAVAFAASVHAVTSRNDRAYGTTVASGLVDGQFARALAQWQRVDVGPHRQYVPVSRAQREAVYEMSPAAAELAPHLEGDVTAWFVHGCRAQQICDDYTGAHFAWALRDAALGAGHMTSGAETERFFGEIAGDIAAACEQDLPCIAPGIGGMPPRERISEQALVRSFGDALDYLLTYEVARPDRGASGGRAWASMVRPLRGIDDRDAYISDEARALDRQEPVEVLMVIYRWGARVGAVLALAGLVAGVATAAGRRRPAAVLACGAMLVAVASRLAVLAIVDATAYPAARIGVYVLPGVDFLVVFVAVGTWLLVTSARATLAARRPSADAAGTGELGDTDGGTTGAAPPPSAPAPPPAEPEPSVVP
jgi:hypothetical protein